MGAIGFQLDEDMGLGFKVVQRVVWSCWYESLQTSISCCDNQGLRNT